MGEGKILLKVNDDSDFYNYDILYDDFYGYKININTDLSVDFESLTSSAGDLDNSIEDYKRWNPKSSMLSFYEDCKKNKFKLLKDAMCIEFDFSIEQVHEYIKQNPILNNKKIIFKQINEFDQNTINKIKDVFGNNTSNIYFEINENYDLINFIEYCNAVKILDNMALDILKYNFSPLEKIMYIYDIVRNRVYNEVDLDQDKLTSRSLSKVLLGDKIVCVGFTKMFDALLKRAGIKASDVFLDDKVDNDNGHVRSEVYVKDEKYGVDGVYFFDPTWDSKKREDDNNYLSSYKFFAMTKTFIDSYEHGEFVAKNFPYFSPDLALKVSNIVDEEDFYGVPKEIINSINHMSDFIYGVPLINTLGLLHIAIPKFKPQKEVVIPKLEELVKYYNSPISANILLNVLYNVRKVEYYSNPSKYKFSIEEFYKIFKNSKWKFEATDIEKFMLLLANKEQMQKIENNQFKQFMIDNEMEKEFLNVKLTKTLRLVYDTKK